MRVLFLYNEVESLAVQYLSRALRDAGHTTGLLFDPKLFDSFRKEYNVVPGLGSVFSVREMLNERLQEFRPDVVAFSIVTPSFSWAQSYARSVRELFPQATILAGGYHCSAAGEDVLRTGLFDYVMRGESEDGIVQLVNSLEDGEVDLETPNLAYLKADSDAYVENPLIPYEARLEKFGFPDKDLFWGLGAPFTSGHMVQLNRGCPWGCTFCGNNYYRRMYFPDRKDYMFTRDFLRMRSVEHCLAEMRWLKTNYGPALLRINDDDLCADEEWLKQLSEQMTDAERMPFKCFVIPNNVNERTVAYLKKMGCEQIQMGVQSLTQKTRQMIGRPNSDNQIAKAIDLITGAGIGLYVDMIFGMPWENEADAQRVEEFYQEHPADFVSVYWLDLWAGSDMLEQAVAAGMIGQEEADAIGRTIREGCISTKRDWHKDAFKPYAARINVRNYFPKSVAKLLISTGLWRVVDKLNLFRWVHLWHALKHVWFTDRYPPAKEGYDLSWLRYPRMVMFYAKLKTKRFFSKRVKLPMTELPPEGQPYGEREKPPRAPVEESTGGSGSGRDAEAVDTAA